MKRFFIRGKVIEPLGLMKPGYQDLKNAQKGSSRFKTVEKTSGRRNQRGSSKKKNKQTNPMDREIAPGGTNEGCQPREEQKEDCFKKMDRATRGILQTQMKGWSIVF